MEQKIEFSDWRGTLSWTLPSEAAHIVAEASPDAQAIILQAIGDHLGILCAGILCSFGNPGMVDTVNAIMREMHQCVNANVANQE